jgi:DNA invertase Pin-like site-specific DNA recombinase
MATAALALATAHEDAPRVYSYTRFSTPEQAAGDSKRRQSEGALRWMERKNAERAKDGQLPLIMDERLSLADLGVSAYRGANTGEDKGLGGFLRACRDGLIPSGSYLIVESLDRVSRMTPRRVSRILDDIVDAGVIIATLSDGQEYDADRLDSDPTALLIALMVSWRAHEESKVKGQRLSAAWAEKRQRVRDGRDTKLTGKGPSWLQWTAQGWKEREPHADTVRRIYSLTLEGMGENKIAQVLNVEAVPVMGRGRMWHRSTISKVLRSPGVIGTLVPGRMDHREGRKQRLLEQLPGAFPAIVSVEDWTAVQALKDGKAPAARGRGANAPLANLFAGLARCPECGATMTRVNKGSPKKGGRPKLVCTRAKLGAANHGYRSVDLAKLQETFIEKWQALFADVPAGTAGAELDKDRDELCGAIEAIESELGDLDQRYSLRSPQAVRVRRQALESFLASYRASLDEMELERTKVDHGLVWSRLENLSAALEIEDGGPKSIDLGKVNAALRSIFHGVTVDYRTGFLRFHWRQGGEGAIMYEWRELSGAR